MLNLKKLTVDTLVPGRFVQIPKEACEDFSGLAELIRISDGCNCCVRVQVLNGGYMHGDTAFVGINSVYLLDVVK